MEGEGFCHAIKIDKWNEGVTPSLAFEITPWKGRITDKESSLAGIICSGGWGGERMTNPFLFLTAELKLLKTLELGLWDFSPWKCTLKLIAYILFITTVYNIPSYKCKPLEIPYLFTPTQ